LNWEINNKNNEMKNKNDNNNKMKNKNDNNNEIIEYEI